MRKKIGKILLIVPILLMTTIAILMTCESLLRKTKNESISGDNKNENAINPVVNTLQMENTETSSYNGKVNNAEKVSDVIGKKTVKFDENLITKTFGETASSSYFDRNIESINQTKNIKDGDTCVKKSSFELNKTESLFKCNDTNLDSRNVYQENIGGVCALEPEFIHKYQTLEGGDTCAKNSSIEQNEAPFPLDSNDLKLNISNVNQQNISRVITLEPEFTHEKQTLEGGKTRAKESSSQPNKAQGHHKSKDTNSDHKNVDQQKINGAIQLNPDFTHEKQTLNGGKTRSKKSSSKSNKAQSHHKSKDMNLDHKIVDKQNLRGVITLEPEHLDLSLDQTFQSCEKTKNVQNPKNEILNTSFGNYDIYEDNSKNVTNNIDADANQSELISMQSQLPNNLQNQNNSCYLDSLIECLYTQKDFVEFINRYKANNDDYNTALYHLNRLFSKMSENIDIDLKTNLLFNRIASQYNIDCTKFNQEDPHEFLKHIFELIGNELKLNYKSNDVCHEMFNRIFQGELFVKSFLGNLNKTTQYLFHDNFIIPGTSIKEGFIDNVERYNTIWYTDTFTDKNVKNHMIIRTLPKCIIVPILRNINGELNSTVVQIDEYLSFYENSKALIEKKKTNYRLNAFISRTDMTNINNGHFVSFCLRNDMWYEFDSLLKYAKPHTHDYVAALRRDNSNVYMLFYAQV